MIRFTPPGNSLYEPGKIFLGYDPETGREIGVSTERHAITIAGARSGKGAALIVPNLLRWPHNVLCIDPSGENVEASWQQREAMGQTVRVLDPFRAANVPDRLRASCNLLASIKPDSLTAREDVRCIADGLVMRFKSEDATWDNGAVSVLAGMIAFVLTDPDTSLKTLPEVRALLRLPDDARKLVFEAMAETSGFGNLAKAAAAIGLSETRKNKEFVGGAVDHSEWLDSGGMAAVLSGSSFQLSELKTGRTSVFLVLPPEYLGEHGRFLRLFVRCSLDAMTKGGKNGQKCLFMLDEFFSLGHLDQISKAAGLLPKNGVHLWPFLQDLGQLTTLYRAEGAQTFFGNSDAHIFFGNTDGESLDYVSKRLGVVTLEESGAEPVSAPQPVYDFWSGDIFQAATGIERAAYETKQNIYNHRLRRVGQPRLTPQEVRETVVKRDPYPVARSMIVFAKGHDVFNLVLAPYFMPAPNIRLPDPVVTPIIKRGIDRHSWCGRAQSMACNGIVLGFVLFALEYLSVAGAGYLNFPKLVLWVSAAAFLGSIFGTYIGDIPPTGEPKVELWQRAYAWAGLFAVSVYSVSWFLLKTLGAGSASTDASGGAFAFALLAFVIGTAIACVRHWIVA